MAGKQTLVASVSLALLLATPAARADDDDGEESAETDPKIQKAPTGYFTIGAGYDADDGFVAQARVAQDDLFGTGVGLSNTARLSARRQLFLLRLTDYRLFDTDVSLTADLYNDTRRFAEFRRRAVGGALTLTAPLGQHTRGFVGYRLEDVALETDFDASGHPLFRDGLVSAVRAGISRDTRDHAWFPTRGSTAGASIEVADRRLGSELGFVKLDGWASKHGRLAGPLTLHTGVRASGVLPRVGGPVPLSERVFLSGHRDIRGYGFGSVAPRGGHVKLVTQTELELTLSKRHGLSAIAFFDAGGVWDLDDRSCQVALSAGAQLVDPCAGRGGSGLLTSAGVGLLWRSPIGPLRFDLAFPLDRKSGGGMEFLFSIGGVF